MIPGTGRLHTFLCTVPIDLKRPGPAKSQSLVEGLRNVQDLVRAFAPDISSVFMQVLSATLMD